MRLCCRGITEIVEGELFEEAEEWEWKRQAWTRLMLSIPCLQRHCCWWRFSSRFGAEKPDQSALLDQFALIIPAFRAACGFWIVWWEKISESDLPWALSLADAPSKTIHRVQPGGQNLKIISTHRRSRMMLVIMDVFIMALVVLKCLEAFSTWLLQSEWDLEVDRNAWENF